MLTMYRSELTMDQHAALILEKLQLAHAILDRMIDSAKAMRQVVRETVIPFQESKQFHESKGVFQPRDCDACEPATKEF